MERNIADYENRYMKGVEGFEKYKVIYRRRKVTEIIDKYQPHKILEIGCGMEPLFLYVKDRKFTVVEPGESLYENAKKESFGNKNVMCIKGFFEEVSENLGEGYDMVICSSLLHEVPDPEKLLQSIVKICGKETIVHINVPNAYSIHRLLGMEMGIIQNIFDKTEKSKEFQQNTNFEMGKLKTMVEDNGMEVIEEGSYFVKPFSHEQMHQMMERKIIDEKILDGLYHITKYMPQFGSEIYVNCKING